MSGLSTITVPTYKSILDNVSARIKDGGGIVTGSLVQEGQPRKGSNNLVLIYVDDAGRKFALRIEKESNIGSRDVESPSKSTGSVTIKERTQLKADAELSASNWRKASEKDLSPKLYYYGYVTKSSDYVSAGSSQPWYLCVISDAYKTDLHKFYKRDGGRWGKGKDTGFEQGLQYLDDVDLEIRRQLSELLIAVSTKMKLICFDIKPLNCVINYDVNADGSINISSIDVKLIDWDADWCKQIVTIGKRVGKNDMVSGWLSQIVMANQFWRFTDWNIFSDFFLSLTYASPSLRSGVTKEKIKEWQSIGPLSQGQDETTLSVLFCSKHTKDYKKMADWYFQTPIMEEEADVRRDRRRLGKPTNTMTLEEKNKICYKYFSLLLKRCTEIYEDTLPSAPPSKKRPREGDEFQDGQPPAQRRRTSRARAQTLKLPSSSASVSIGGRRRRKKRKSRNKKRQNRRKRMKTRRKKVRRRRKTRQKRRKR